MRRTDLLSKRDLEVLDFVARFGVVSRSAVQLWAGTGRSTTFARERRLRQADLLCAVAGVWGGIKIVLCTAMGLKAVGRSELRPASFSLATVSHEVVVAEHAARYERSGVQAVSEREIVLHERLVGQHVYSAVLPDGRTHRADLIRLSDDELPEAIEVELAVKSSTRLDELLRAWRRAVAERRLSRVVYLCAPHVAPVVERAIERTRTGGAVQLELL